MNNLEKLIEDHWIDCKYETCKSALPEFKEGCKNCKIQSRLQIKRIYENLLNFSELCEDEDRNHR